MLLSDDTIKSKRLVVDDVAGNYRPAGYDLSVGKIITVEGQEVSKNSYWLAPQGIVEVISRETIKLPKDVAGYAMVKTALCNKGILALNIGIVDPGYDGPLSTTLINFGKREFQLDVNSVFLRVTFHECETSSRSTWPQPVNRQEYVADKKAKVQHFGNTFLNLQSAVEKVTDPIFKRYKIQLIAIAALVLTVFPLIVTLGVDYLSRTSWTKEQIKEEMLREIRAARQSELESKIRELDDEIKSLKAGRQPAGGSAPAEGSNQNTNPVR